MPKSLYYSSSMIETNSISWMWRKNDSLYWNQSKSKREGVITSEKQYWLIALSIIDYTNWIDVCKNDVNLVASVGDENIKIYDRRVFDLVKTFENVHSGSSFNQMIYMGLLIQVTTLGNINCVRWDQNGYMLATASNDKTMRIIDFTSGKILYSGNTQDESKANC